MYKVWKSGINTYRVFNTITGQIVEEKVENLILHNCKFEVNLAKLFLAAKREFKNSNDPFDFFAYIECEKYEVKKEPNVFHRLTTILYFNPLVGLTDFVDRITGEVVKKANWCLIEGNKLKYI